MVFDILQHDREQSSVPVDISFVFVRYASRAWPRTGIKIYLVIENDMSLFPALSRGIWPRTARRRVDLWELSARDAHLKKLPKTSYKVPGESRRIAVQL